MNFLIKDQKILINIIKFGKKLAILSKKKVDAELIYNKKYL